MVPFKTIPASEFRSVTRFSTDAEYQSFHADLRARHGLDDGYGYTICEDGRVFRREKLQLSPKKISKSDQS